MSLDMVELWQEPKTEQTALQAAVPAQQARLPMLRMPPISSLLKQLTQFSKNLNDFTSVS